MTLTYRKKLIEVSLPLDAINAASINEKSVRHGHPSTLHLWWARRPLAAARAVLFAQLVDDPSSYADELLDDSEIRAQAESDLKLKMDAWKRQKRDQDGKVDIGKKPTLSECAIDIKRKELFDIIESMVKWKNSSNDKIMNRARDEILRSCNGKVPAIYDPFSGGGAIPLEAQRLGLNAYGSDLNPVAVMIGKSMIEVPPRFRNAAPVNPGAHEKIEYRNAQGLSEDIKYYGNQISKKAWDRIGKFYPGANSGGGGQRYFMDLGAHSSESRPGIQGHARSPNIEL